MTPPKGLVKAMPTMNDDQKTIAKALRMRTRDFRNGVQKVLDAKHDKIVTKNMWETIGEISGLMVDLNEQMCDALKIDVNNSIDASIRNDMTDLMTTCKDNMLTPAERKAKAKAAKALDDQIAELLRQKAEL